MSTRRALQEKKMLDFMNKFPDVANLKNRMIDNKVNTITGNIGSTAPSTMAQPIAQPMAQPMTQSMTQPMTQSMAQPRVLPKLPTVNQVVRQNGPPIPARPVYTNTPRVARTQNIQIPIDTPINPLSLKLGNLVTVSLNGGLGNWIFKSLAGLGYAEKHGKTLVLTRSYITGRTSFPHECNLEPHISRIFPGLKYVDSIPHPLIIKEQKVFSYAPIQNSVTNVILMGYFQAEGYFPSSKFIPDIRTNYYPHTYFIHIRAGDYINNNEWGVDLYDYHRQCFSILGKVKYLVFSNDNEYADNYMKRFDIPYTISNKVDQVDTLIEMANCAGGICANSSFSWLGAFFQLDKRGKVFMPSIWLKTQNVKGVYPAWATVISTKYSENPIINGLGDSSEKPVIEDVLQQYTFGESLTLVEWQSKLKDVSSLIVHANSVPGGDLWMPFPLGMYWTYAKYFNNSTTWQVGNHEFLVACAINDSSDERRRVDDDLNRKIFIETLRKNGIHNIMIDETVYFSQLPRYKFIVAPSGSGIDSHRYYEALIAGCIPIMEFNEQVQEKYEGLPILYTNDYSEINSGYLCQKYEEMKDIQYDFRKLFLAYYSSEEQQQIKNNGNYWIKGCCVNKKGGWY